MVRCCAARTNALLRGRCWGLIIVRSSLPAERLCSPHACPSRLSRCTVLAALAKMAPASQTDFAESWRKYKRLRDTLVVLSACFFFIGPLTDLAVSSFGFAPANAHFLVDGTWVLAEFFTAKALRSWKCPQCGKSFYGGRRSQDKFSTYWDWWFLPRQCASCGLPRYSQLPLQDGSPGTAVVRGAAPFCSRESP